MKDWSMDELAGYNLTCVARCMKITALTSKKDGKTFHKLLFRTFSINFGEREEWITVFKNPGEYEVAVGECYILNGKLVKKENNGYINYNLLKADISLYFN